MSYGLWRRVSGAVGRGITRGRRISNSRGRGCTLEPLEGRALLSGGLGNDLALGRPAVASSHFKNLASFDAPMVSDGDAATRWKAGRGQAAGSWIYVDLGSEHDISKLRVGWGARAGQFHVRLAPDGVDPADDSSWHSTLAAVTHTGHSSTLAVREAARYVGLEVTSGRTVSVRSLKVFGSVPVEAAAATESTDVGTLSAPSVTADAVPAPVLPAMPNSDKWFSAIVNANQYITSPYYMPNLSPDLGLITDLAGDTAANYTAAVAQVQAAHPNTLIGTYHSSRDAQLANTFTTYPRRAVPREGLTASQILMKEPGSTVADIVNYTQAAARKYLVSNVVQDVAKSGSRLAYLDNVSHNENGFPISWATTTSVIKDMATQLHAQGKRVIVNAAWIPGITSNTSVDQLIATGVDGVSLEMAFHANVRNDVTKINTAMAQYRKMLDAGMTVVFIPLGSATGDADTVENMEVEQRLQAAFGMMFRKPGDKLFTNQLFWRSIPEWADWTARFGPALGAANVSKNAAGEIIMTRQFTNYTLTVNVNTKTVTYA